MMRVHQHPRRRKWQTSLFAPALLALLPGGDCSSAEADARDTLTVRIKAIAVSDDDGARRANITPEQFEKWVAFSNRVYNPAGIRFLFDPDRDFAELASTILNGMTGTSDANWLEASARGNEVAAQFPQHITVFVRHGPEPHPTGGGFSWWDYNFVVMPGWHTAAHCGEPNFSSLAHEIGHYLGLPHTFVGDPFVTIEDAELAFEEADQDPRRFDGDGIADTPPDPGIRPLECDRRPLVQLLGRQFALPRRNIMSYYVERDSLTPMQAARARWILQYRLRHGMAIPSHAAIIGAIEFEDLTVTSRRRVTTQNMTPFGLGLWSNDRQLFYDAQDGSSLTISVPVERRGRYRVMLYSTLAPDYGIWTVEVEGRRTRAVVDGYAPVVLPSGPVDLGIYSLRRGMMQLTVRSKGKNDLSTGFRIGLDCLVLEPVARR